MSEEAFDGAVKNTKPSRPGPSLKARAVRFLSMREHTRQELVRKLAPYAENEQVLQTVLDELERQGWQSDERFVRSFEDSKLKRYGVRRIASDMRERGVGESLVRDSMDRLKTSEPQRAWDVWNRRFGQSGLPADTKEYARQARFLAARGFDADVVRKILSARYDPEAFDE